MGCSILTSASSKLAGWGPSSLLEAMFVYMGGYNSLNNSINPPGALSQACLQFVSQMSSTFGLTDDMEIWKIPLELHKRGTDL